MDASNWICPECGGSNSILRCTCGYEPTQPNQPELNDRAGDPLRVLELLNNANQRQSWLKNLLALIVSLAFFFLAGLINLTLRDILLIAITIFVHESGHLLAMKLVGYRSLQMLFIPFLGGVAYGKATEESAANSATVTLFGPLVGIISAVLSGFLFKMTGGEYFKAYTEIAVYINVFNLLPIYPLDGGRFFNDLLLSRHPRVELSFRALAAVLLAVVSIMYSDWIWLILCITILLPIKRSSALSQIAETFEGKYGKRTVADQETISFLTGELMSRVPSIAASGEINKTLATYIREIFIKVNYTHASFKELFILLAFYVVTLTLLPFLALTRLY